MVLVFSNKHQTSNVSNLSSTLQHTIYRYKRVANPADNTNMSVPVAVLIFVAPLLPLSPFNLPFLVSLPLFPKLESGR